MFISLFTEHLADENPDAGVVCSPPLGATTVVEANGNPVHEPLSLPYIHIVYTVGRHHWSLLTMLSSSRSLPSWSWQSSKNMS